PGTQQISDIEASLANAQTASANATKLNTQTQSTLQDMLQGIEGVDQNTIGAEILTLQNNLSASMSVTARLAQISLVNYLSAPSAAQTTAEPAGGRRIVPKSRIRCSKKIALARRGSCAGNRYELIAFFRGGAPGGSVQALSQAGSDAAIDIDQRKQMVAPRLCHERERLTHHEDPDIGDVLAHLKRQLVIVLDH